ncbi:antibiotic biosynthesis monooxygenase family protein [Streptomyces sp. Da 82-17]|uniref:antibiotic biosynthesis monooxygenase family protein n=1 Tax=Streptomyces sp. Da 82-17 TaxID=3377116 RepID=UPI0038D472CF
MTTDSGAGAGTGSGSRSDAGADSGSGSGSGSSAGGPLAAFEPPYYAVIFTSLRTEGDQGYGEVAERMDELVQEVPGFLGVESARTPGGLGITVGYFESTDAIEEWRSQAEHRAAQRNGRKHWYESYSVHVTKVERSYSFVRGQRGQREQRDQ